MAKTGRWKVDNPADLRRNIHVYLGYAATVPHYRLYIEIDQASGEHSAYHEG